MLLDKGGNIYGRWGNEGLLYAVTLERNEQVVEFLVGMGADPYGTLAMQAAVETCEESFFKNSFIT